MPTTPASLGDLERAVMDVLWDHAEPQTVRQVHERLAERDLAYTTVLTVLDRLAKKGLTTRARDGRMWRYAAASTREELTASAMHESLRSLGGTDRAATMLHFLGEAAPGELDDLRAALAELERRHRSPAG